MQNDDATMINLRADANQHTSKAKEADDAQPCQVNDAHAATLAFGLIAAIMRSSSCVKRGTKLSWEHEDGEGLILQLTGGRIVLRKPKEDDQA
jgi:hypothetical protein